MKRLSFLFLSAVMFALFACGGGGGSSSSVSGGGKTGAPADIPSSWGADVKTADSTQAKAASKNVTNLAGTIIGKLGQAGKKAKETQNINSQVINGSHGGKVTVSGKIETDVKGGSAVYPMNVNYKLDMVFDNYQEATFAVNGKFSYEGVFDMQSASKWDITFEMKGNIAYKDAGGVYSLDTKLKIVMHVDGNQTTGTFDFTVDGERYQGSLNDL